MRSRNKKITVHTIEKVSDRERIDKYLTEMLDGKSRSYIQKLIEGNNVLINGRVVSKNCRVRAGETLEVRDLEEFGNPPDIKPQEIDLNILFEDRHLLIISKPAGISVHPSPGNYSNTLVNALLFHFEKYMRDFPDRVRPGIVHRLDKETSGILIIAKNHLIQGKLSELFKNRAVKKCYIALVLGLFNEKNGRIELPIGRSKIDRKKMQVSIDRGRDAITRFTVKDSFRNNCSLVDILPETGRTHQIRVHFSYIDHPLIGDKKYGNKETEGICKDIGLKRHFLHAYKLAFLHPVTDKKIEIEDDLPEDLAKGLGFLKEFKI